MDPETKKKYRKIFEELNPGSVFMSNKEIDLTAITPDIKSSDFTEGARYPRNLIGGAAGIPEHWLGEGGDVNRATALAMDLPTLRSFLQQQAEFVEIIRVMARANLVSVSQHGRIPVEEVDNFTVHADPMSPKDVGQTTTALSTAVSALSAAKMEGWVSDREARQVVANILSDVIEVEDDEVVLDDQTTDLPNAVVNAMRNISRATGEEPIATPDNNGNGANAPTP